jgi:DNA-directed RNA polymerase subunit RPC12/RpoP
MKKIFVDDANQATIVCPKCGFEKNIDVTDFKNTQKKLKVKCKCGETHPFIIEFRRRYRKDVSLPGEYINQGKGEQGEIIIRELSMSGIRFESLRPHKISTNDTLDVTFNLDNPMRSKIRRVFKAIWVRDRMIGANCSDPRLYEKDLGFYLKV